MINIKDNSFAFEYFLIFIYDSSIKILLKSKYKFKDIQYLIIKNFSREINLLFLKLNFTCKIIVSF
jgi:hypothetical protein